MQLPLQCYPNPSFAIASGTGLLPQPSMLRHLTLALHSGQCWLDATRERW